jgi:uncharacterized protein
MKTSIDDLTERQQHDVQIITTFLRDALDEFLVGKAGSKQHFRILKIILFGSQAKGTQVYDPVNGYISDYDVLVIVNREKLVEEFDLWKQAEDRIQRCIGRPLGLIVHSLRDVNERLSQGQYFFRDIREEGILLYNGDKRDLALPGNLSVAEQKQIAEKYFQQWFSSACVNREVYEVVMAKDLTKKEYINNAAFNLHQATERFYSCVLLVITNYLPKTHNIEVLRSFCIRQDERFIEKFPLDNRFHKRSFQRLKRAYVDARYSEHYEITVEELEYLATEVTRLQHLVEEICQSWIDSLTDS